MNKSDETKGCDDLLYYYYYYYDDTVNISIHDQKINKNNK